jgi:hypothetical protein
MEENERNKACSMKERKEKSIQILGGKPKKIPVRDLNLDYKRVLKQISQK